jgi:hypothetical protein
MTKVFYQTVLQENPALRRAEVREVAVLEQVNGAAAAAVPASPAGIYALAMQRVKAAQQELRKDVIEQQDKAEPVDETAAVMSDMVALPGEGSQGETLVLAQASQAPRATPTPKSKSATSQEEEDDDGGFLWLIGGFGGLVGALGGSRASASVEPTEGCDFNTELVLPSRPSAASALVIDVARGANEIQGSGSAGVEYTADHTALLISVGDHANLHGEESTPGSEGGALFDPFVVNASVDMGDIHYSAGVSAMSSVLVNASGSVGDVVIKTSAKTAAPSFEAETSNYLAVSAGGDVGNVYFLASGANAGGGFNTDFGNFSRIDEFAMGIDANGGNVGEVNVRLANPDGGAWFNVSAYAASGAGGLVGGSVGDVNFIIDGAEASGHVYVRASGGDVGDVTFTTVGGSASGMLYLSAFAQIDASGNVYGGNIGDITSNIQGFGGDNDIRVNTTGAVGADGVYLGGGKVGNVTLNMCNEAAALAGNSMTVSAYNGGSVGDVYVAGADGSGSARVYIYTYGVVNDDGIYDSGGNIGNVTVWGRGSSGRADADLTAYSGGSVGTIQLIVTAEDQAPIAFSASAAVSAYVYGVGDWIAEIGDVTMDVYGGLDSSAAVNLNGMSGAEIGNITARVHGGQAGGHGTAVGEISISAYSYANAVGSGGVIGNISVIDTSFGGDTEIDLYADTRIGSVSVAAGEGPARVRMDLEAGAGATVGAVSITFDDANFASGGHSGSYLNMDFSAGAVDMGNVTLTGGSEFSTFEVSGGQSVNVGNIDASGYLGFVGIDLAGVQTGTRIDSGQGESWIAGTEGSDDIYLGDGDDTISFQYFHPGEGVDDIFNFEAGADALNVYGSGFIDIEALTTNVDADIVDGDVVSLVNIAGGDNLSTEVGLLNALNTGEYNEVDSASDGKFTFVTAAFNSSTTFNVFEVSHSGGSYTTAYLMAVVDLKNDLNFGNLTVADFV